MKSIKAKAGFTLIELMVAMGAAGSLAVIDAHDNNVQTTQEEARALGNEVFQYETAVSRFLAANVGDVSVVGTYTGSSWLKDSSCSGMASEKYLPCNVIPGGSTVSFGISPVTTVTSDADNKLSARTVWDVVRGDDGNPDTLAMGLAAIVASGSYISQHEDMPAGYIAPTVFCPNLAAVSAALSGICQTDANRIVSSSNISPTTNLWLRTDHENTMRAALEFDPSGAVSSNADLQSADNRSDGSWLRQIVGVSRLYNRAGSGQSLALGNAAGNSIYSDAFLTTNGLLNGAVIVDGDAAIMRDFYAKYNAYVGGNLDVGGDISSGRDIRATRDVISGRDLRSNNDVRANFDVISDNGDIVALNGDVNARDINASRDVIAQDDIIAGDDITADGNITAIGNMYTQRVYDRNNTSKYIDPSSRSQISSLTASSDIRATRFYDQNNTYYYTDPSSTSRINGLDVRGRSTFRDYIQLTKNVSKNGSCSPNGLVAKFSDGQLANCVSGKWQAVGGGTGYAHLFKAHAGKTVSCRPTYRNSYTDYTASGRAYARVLSDGTPQVKSGGAWRNAAPHHIQDATSDPSYYNRGDYGGRVGLFSFRGTQKVKVQTGSINGVIPIASLVEASCTASWPAPY